MSFGQVNAEKRPGRSVRANVTLFGSVGRAFRDLAAGGLAFDLARHPRLSEYSEVCGCKGAPGIHLRQEQIGPTRI